MPIRVEVPPRYVRRARQLATERNRSFEEDEEYDNEADTWGTAPELRNFVGLIGEFAFAEYADLTVDTSATEWTDGGYDFEVDWAGEHRTVDIKTAQKTPSALMVKEYAVKADCYVLGHLEEENVVTFYGYATVDKVVNGVQKESPYGHVNYTLGLEYLDELPPPGEIAEWSPT